MAIGKAQGWGNNSGDNTNYVWRSDIKTPFKLVYDPETHLVEATIQ
jgi:hypothetical protein